MSLKAYVKVGTLSNLGDVRYCAGMGVDMIGFQVIPGQPDYLEASRFQEIRGWVSGPLFVAEIYGLRDTSVVETLLENYKPDYLELGVDEVLLLETYPLPYILRLLPGQTMPEVTVKPRWIITKEFTINSEIPVLLQVDTVESVVEATGSSGVAGIAFKVEAAKFSGAGVHEFLGPLLEVMEEE